MFKHFSASHPNSIKKPLLYWTLTLAILIGVMFLISLGTSPVYPHNFSYDSAFFRFIGKEILKGKVPYRDVWDHKGPVLYFLQALGALGGTTNKGTNILFLMQLLSISVSTYFQYKIYCLFEDDSRSFTKFMMYLISLCSVFSITIESGNLSEEWCLPMTCCSLYLLTKFSVNAKNDGKHPRAYAFIHGIMIGLMMLIRANNAFPVCAGIFFIGFFFVYKETISKFF